MLSSAVIKAWASAWELVSKTPRTRGHGHSYQSRLITVLLLTQSIIGINIHWSPYRPEVAAGREAPAAPEGAATAVGKEAPEVVAVARVGASADQEEASVASAVARGTAPAVGVRVRGSAPGAAVPAPDEAARAPAPAAGAGPGQAPSGRWAPGQAGADPGPAVARGRQFRSGTERACPYRATAGRRIRPNRRRNPQPRPGRRRSRPGCRWSPAPLPRRTAARSRRPRRRRWRTRWSVRPVAAR